MGRSDAIPFGLTRFDSRIPANFPWPSSLRDDLNHTRCRFGAVQRRSRRSLDYFDGLDIGGIDSVERRGGLSEHRIVALTLVVMRTPST